MPQDLPGTGIRLGDESATIVTQKHDKFSLFQTSVSSSEHLFSIINNSQGSHYERGYGSYHLIRVCSYENDNKIHRVRPRTVRIKLLQDKRGP